MTDIRIYGIHHIRNAIAAHPTGDFGLVSILSPSSKTPEFVEPDNPAHLHLKFYDIDEAREGSGAPTTEHVQQLIDAASEILGHKTVFCHCYGGVSRSTAAAIILHYLDLEDAEKAAEAILEAKPACLPNRLLLSLADQLLDTELESIASDLFDY